MVNKQITISVSNKELNALEELLTVKLSEKDYEAKRKTCLTLWGKLVKEFDKPKAEMKYIYEYLISYSFFGRAGRAIVERDQEIISPDDIVEIENDIGKDSGDVEVVLTNFILLNRKEQ